MLVKDLYFPEVFFALLFAVLDLVLIFLQKRILETCHNLLKFQIISDSVTFCMSLHSLNKKASSFTAHITCIFMTESEKQTAIFLLLSVIIQADVEIICSGM